MILHYGIYFHAGGRFGKVVAYAQALDQQIGVQFIYLPEFISPQSNTSSKPIPIKPESFTHLMPPPIFLSQRKLHSQFIPKNNHYLMLEFGSSYRKQPSGITARVPIFFGRPGRSFLQSGDLA